MLEYFVHLDPGDRPKDLVVVTADVPDSVSRMSLSDKQLPKAWRQTPPPPELAAIGDHFVARGRATVLMVPSAMASIESNWLINPAHGEFSKIRVHRGEAFEYDPRFFRS